MKLLRPGGSVLVAAVMALLPLACRGTEALADGLYAVIHTPKGNITAGLFPDKAPVAVANFVGLAEGTIPFEGRPAGKPFYDGLVFHRVVPDFVVQGGDPLGTGDGGPGYYFPDEFTPAAKHVKGALAMANDGPNTNGSQFYFAISEVHRLNYKHTVFGVVHSGMDVLTNIQQGDPMERVQIVRVGETGGAYHVTPESFAALRAAARVIQPRDESLPPLYANDGVDLDLPDWFPQWIADKLNHYQQVRGPEIFVRLYKKHADMPGEPRESLRLLFKTLSAGNENACLLLYIADEKRWRFWIGDTLVPVLTGLAGDFESDEAHHKLSEVKARILAPAKVEIEADKPRRSIDAATTSLIETLDAISAPN